MLISLRLVIYWYLNWFQKCISSWRVRRNLWILSKKPIVNKFECNPTKQLTQSISPVKDSPTQKEITKERTEWQPLSFIKQCFHFIHYLWSPAIEKVYPDFMRHKWDRQKFWQTCHSFRSDESKQRLFYSHKNQLNTCK